jgi:hypothetical protein
MDCGANIFANDGEIFAKIEIVAQFIDCCLTLCNLVRRRGRREPLRQHLLTRPRASLREQLKKRIVAEYVEIDGVGMGIAELGIDAIGLGCHPAIFDTRKATLVKTCCALCLASEGSHCFVTSDEDDEDYDRNKDPPSGEGVRPGGEPHDYEKHNAGYEAYVTDAVVQSFVVLDPGIAGFEASSVFFGGSHFSGPQVFTSEAIFPRSEFKPDPSP